MSTPRSNAAVPGASADAPAALLRASARDGLWLPVEGVSMLPTITAGSQVRVVARTRMPRLAEIWAFCGEGGAVVVHRFRRRDTAGRYVFRGDNVVHRDAPVEAACLIGEVTAVRQDERLRRFGTTQRLAWLVRRASVRVRRIRRLRRARHP